MSWSTCPECGHNWSESLETPGYGICPRCGHDNNEPEEMELLSICCTALPLFGTHDSIGVCSACKETTEFTDGSEE